MPNLSRYSIVISVLMIIVSLINLTLNIESKGHYFGNGVVFGIGLTVLFNQIIKIRQLKNKVK